MKKSFLTTFVVITKTCVYESLPCASRSSSPKTASHEWRQPSKSSSKMHSKQTRGASVMVDKPVRQITRSWLSSANMRRVRKNSRRTSVTCKSNLRPKTRK